MKRKKQCPPLPAQRRNLNEHTSKHTGPNLCSLMSSHQWTDTPVKFLVVFFSCLSVKSSFIQTEHVVLDSSIFFGGILVYHIPGVYGDLSLPPHDQWRLVILVL